MCLLFCFEPARTPTQFSQSESGFDVTKPPHTLSRSSSCRFQGLAVTPRAAGNRAGVGDRFDVLQPGELLPVARTVQSAPSGNSRASRRLRRNGTICPAGQDQAPGLTPFSIGLPFSSKRWNSPATGEKDKCSPALCSLVPFWRMISGSSAPISI